MKKQIVSKITDGLGNQLFQYAMGRAMALRSGSSLLLDKRYFNTTSRVAFRLDHFNVGRTLTEDRLPPLRHEERLRYTFWRRLKLKPRPLREGGLAFQERLMAPISNVWLEGYWQSERYFEDVADIIRNDLLIITTPSQENRNHLASISAAPAVSLHVRRGDYLLPEHRGLFATCSQDYYIKALELIASKMADDPVVYVFSDDPEWARDNLALPFEKRVMGHNGRDADYEDMRLMSACRHHVIANSTFSWWGAWLNPSPDKIVVAPETWFIDLAASNPDIIPDSWTKLAN